MRMWGPRQLYPVTLSVCSVNMAESSVNLICIHSEYTNRTYVFIPSGPALVFLWHRACTQTWVHTCMQTDSCIWWLNILCSAHPLMHTSMHLDNSTESYISSHSECVRACVCVSSFVHTFYLNNFDSILEKHIFLLLLQNVPEGILLHPTHPRPRLYLWYMLSRHKLMITLH